MNYQHEYNKIIDFRLKNKLTKSNEIYTETHHIIPRSLGGNDDTVNLVELTGKEHYLCHYYLYQTYEKHSLFYSKMLSAFNIMNMKSYKSSERYFDPDLYQECKESRRENYKFRYLERINELCDFIDKNKRIPNYDSEGKEKTLYYLICVLRDYHRREFLWYDEYYTLTEKRGYPDLFDGFKLDKLTFENINKLCDFIDDNKRNPKST